MPTFYDSQNKPYVLTEQLGRGGEGAVFSCEDDFELVAKIYHQPVTEEKAEKLRWMADNKNEHLLKVAAWVVDVLKDAPDGKVVGFLMPNVRAKEIHELYSLKSRRVHFPEATWHFLVHTAANLARGFYSLHRDKHVMGDINHGNCVVLADGTVKLIDCDSYSISRGDFRYRCEVGVATHLAPELQRVDLGEIEREAKHDNFGLAVIIFQLLFLGRHPFSGNFLGAEDKSLEDCIREKRFAYGDNIDITKVKQPPGTLSLAEVSPRIAAMFEHAFLIDDRPEPREWVEALEDLSSSLEQCTLHPGHHYYNKLAVCPWCRIEAQTGLILFPFVNLTSDVNGEKTFNIFTIENLIENLGINRNLPAKPPNISTMILPPPSPGLDDTRRQNRNRQIIIITSQFLIVSFLMVVFGVGAGVFFGIILMIFFVIALNNPDKNLRKDFNERLFETRQKWNEIEDQWNKALVPQKVDEELNEIRKRTESYKKFQQSIARQMSRLQENFSARQFEEYLQSFRLVDLEVSSVVQPQITELRVRGIRTAADIDAARMEKLAGIDEKTKKSLLEWRVDLESKFDSDAKSEEFEIEQKKLIQENTVKRRVIEREIERLFSSLRVASLYLRQHQQNLVAKSESVSKELIQAESDINALGNSSSAILVLILVTFLTPFWGGIISELTSSPSKTVIFDKSYPPPPMPISKTGSGSGSGRGSGTGSGISSTRTVNSNIPSENITDQEIAAFSATERENYASTLFDEAENAVRQNDYYSAERKLLFAVRFTPKDIKILNRLGYVLYLEGKYPESLDILNSSRKIDKDNSETKNFIGINYLQLRRYKDARQIFTELTEGNKNSLEKSFNLGLAYEGLKDYKSAVKAFREAVKIKNGDADSHYELGYCLYKTGDKSGAYSEYEFLKSINSTLAQKLYDVAELEKYDYEIQPPPNGTGSGVGYGSGRGSGSGY
jgi:DNA-binding helix-hairpin-helix protein with protein kinase domain/Flp pilus assembly protein TadD